MFIANKKQKFFKFLGWYIVATSELLLKLSIFWFFVFLAIESFKNGLISNYFDLNILLTIAVISGLILLLFDDKGEIIHLKKVHYPYLAVFVILLGLLIFINLKDLQEFRLITAIIVMVSGFFYISFTRKK